MCLLERSDSRVCVLLGRSGSRVCVLERSESHVCRFAVLHSPPLSQAVMPTNALLRMKTPVGLLWFGALLCIFTESIASNVGHRLHASPKREISEFPSCAVSNARAHSCHLCRLDGGPWYNISSSRLCGGLGLMQQSLFEDVRK